MNAVTRSLAACAAVACAALAFTAPAQADAPAVIASASGACASSPDDRANQYQNLTLPALSAGYDQVLQRVSVNASSPANSWANWGVQSVHAAGDVTWMTGGQVRPGSVINTALTCSAGGFINATFDLMAVPATPTSFSGAITPAAGSSQQTSQMAFIAPLQGQYRLTFDVSQGAISAEGTQITSHAEKDLSIPAGVQYINVAALDGPQARYTVSVAALPVTVSAFSVTPSLARQGAALKIPYTLSGDATVTVRVLDAAGQAVRVLADQLTAQQGDRSVRWDGIGANGTPVPDGRYTIDLTVTDAAGAHTQTATVTLDRTAPLIQMPSRVTRSHAIVAVISDPVAGVKDAVLRVNGRKVASAVAGRIIYRPRGFGRGARLNVSVTATDKAGNTTSRDRRYKVH